MSRMTLRDWVDSRIVRCASRLQNFFEFSSTFALFVRRHSLFTLPGCQAGAKRSIGRMGATGFVCGKKVCMSRSGKKSTRFAKRSVSFSCDHVSREIAERQCLSRDEMVTWARPEQEVLACSARSEEYRGAGWIPVQHYLLSDQKIWTILACSMPTIPPERQVRPSRTIDGNYAVNEIRTRVGLRQNSLLASSGTPLPAMALPSSGSGASRTSPWHPNLVTGDHRGRLAAN